MNLFSLFKMHATHHFSLNVVTCIYAMAQKLSNPHSKISYTWELQVIVNLMLSSLSYLGIFINQSGIIVGRTVMPCIHYSKMVLSPL